MAISTRVREFLTLAINDLARTHRLRRGLRRRRAIVESLEARTLLTAYSVTNLNDAGAGSLRDAISQANVNTGADEISFSVSGTVTLTTGEIAITDSVTITGPGADKLAVSGGNRATRIFQIDNSSASLIDVAISNLTIRDAGNGVALLDGAGLRSSENLTLRGVVITGNNAASRGGGGIQISGGNFVLQDSTISNNRANQGGGLELFGNSATIVNSTISGNWANGHGGGLIALLGATTVLNSTITNNRCDADGSGEGVNGGAAGNEGLLTLHNTIVAGNFQGTGTTPWDASQLTASSSHNLIGFAGPDVWITNGVNGNIVGVNGSGIRDIATILNTTLANNGGPTQTHALVPGSLAIDNGSNAAVSEVAQAVGLSLTTDQRGVPIARISNTTVDIGAYELFTVTNPIVVSTTVDELDNSIGSGDLSLREAIMLANSSPGANTITFAATTNGTEFDLNLGPMTISETVTITGNGATRSVVDAQRLSRIFEMTDTAGNVTLNDMTFRNGQTRGNGTDFWDTAFAGGAVHWASPGTLTLNRSIIAGNSTSGERAGGGAILVARGTLLVSECWFFGNTTAGVNSEGGAISAHLGALLVRNSTFSGNSTTGNFSEGGALFSLIGNVSISQSTLSGNIASGIDSQGGGLFTQQGNVVIGQSTITENKATISAGGGIFTLSSPITILNSIVASNSDAGSSPEIRTSPDPGDVFLISNSFIGRNNGTNLAATSGTTPDANGNFIGGNTDATKIDPKLGPLANNGGSTRTHALLTGSLAIDQGRHGWAVDVTNGNVPLVSDQRGVGFTRILDGDSLGTAPAAVVDMGAFEFPGLRVISPNPNAFTLRPTFQWTPIAGATSYSIQINNESTNVASFHVATSTSATYTPPANLAIGKFRMWIRPNFAAGQGNWSAPHLFNNLTPPTWQTMTRTQLTSRPTLNWNALPGAAKYDLWMDNSSTGQKQLIRQDVIGTSFTPAADLQMGLYRFWIRGVDANGNFASWSVLQEFLVVPGPTPIGPQSATFDRTPTFSWNSVTGAASYELFVRNQTTGAMVINGQSVAGTNFTPASNLTDGLHRWWTLAVSQAFTTGAIKSGGTNPLDIFIGGRPTFITPTNGASTSDRTPTFSWKPVDGAVTYRLQVNRIDVPQVGIINQVGITGTSFTAAADLPAGTYRAWVRAVSATNELSPWSIEVNFTVTAADPAGDATELDYRLAGFLVSELLPAVEAQEPSDQQLDRLMAEFATGGFLGERLGVSPPCPATLSPVSDINTPQGLPGTALIGMKIEKNESHSEG